MGRSCRTREWRGSVGVPIGATAVLEVLLGLPGGDGKFGHAVRTGPSSAELSSEPVKVCLPGSELPLSFRDSAVRLADMNADGLVDIVSVKRNYIEYWPGRGDGRWGDGDLERCRAGQVQAAPSIVMSSVPLTTADIGKAELADVSGAVHSWWASSRRWLRGGPKALRITTGADGCS